MYSFKSFCEEKFFHSSSFNLEDQKSFTSGFENYVYPIIGSLALDEISFKHSDLVLNNLVNASLSKTTVMVYYSFIRRVFLFAIKCGLLKSNPFVIHFDRSCNVFSFPSSFEDHKRVLNAISVLPLKNLFGFCYFSGLPIRVLRNLNFSALDYSSRTLTLNSSKYQGLFSISSNAFVFLEDELNRHSNFGFSNSFLFLSDSGKKISDSQCILCSHILSNLLDLPSFSTSFLWKGYANVLRLSQEFSNG